jgi:transcriptional regulator with XRE-family HTH domain
LSQREVGDLIGVAPATISRYESGSRKPRGPHVDAYAELLAALAREMLR